MTAFAHLTSNDRRLALAFAVLALATLVAAAQAHALCSIVCLHGQPMTEICAGVS